MPTDSRCDTAGINIFILFFFMSYMFFNPVRDMLKKRQDKIKK